MPNPVIPYPTNSSALKLASLAILHCARFARKFSQGQMLTLTKYYSPLRGSASRCLRHLDLTPGANQFYPRSQVDLDLGSEVIYFLKPHTPNNFHVMTFPKIPPPSGTLCSAQTTFSPPEPPPGPRSGAEPPYDLSWTLPHHSAKVSGHYLQRCANALMQTYPPARILAYRYRLAQQQIYLL